MQAFAEVLLQAGEADKSQANLAQQVPVVHRLWQLVSDSNYRPIANLEELVRGGFFVLLLLITNRCPNLPPAVNDIIQELGPFTAYPSISVDEMAKVVDDPKTFDGGYGGHRWKRFKETMVFNIGSTECLNNIGMDLCDNLLVRVFGRAELLFCLI